MEFNFLSRILYNHDVDITVPILSAKNFNNAKFRTAILEKEHLSSVVTDDPPTDEGKKNDFISNDAMASIDYLRSIR